VLDAPSEPESEPVKGAARSALPLPPEAKPKAAEPVIAPAAPSQVAFESPEPPAADSKAASTLAEETRLLDAAFAALAQGNRTRAAELIREHETRFPKGLLGRERERARVRLNESLRGE
jgi:hypothetical protein